MHNNIVFMSCHIEHISGFFRSIFLGKGKIEKGYVRNKLDELTVQESRSNHGRLRLTVIKRIENKKKKNLNIIDIHMLSKYNMTRDGNRRGFRKY